MSSELYLIAHKVRNQPAFDIATRIECPECIAMGCPECDDLGYWWIVPTSGHRAYPFWDLELAYLCDDVGNSFMKAVPAMPPDCPDHYPIRSAPTISLTQALGLDKPTKPSAPIPRRF